MASIWKNTFLSFKELYGWDPGGKIIKIFLIGIVAWKQATLAFIKNLLYLYIYIFISAFSYFWSRKEKLTVDWLAAGLWAAFNSHKIRVNCGPR